MMGTRSRSTSGARRVEMPAEDSMWSTVLWSISYMVRLYLFFSAYVYFSSVQTDVADSSDYPETDYVGLSGGEAYSDFAGVASVLVNGAVNCYFGGEAFDQWVAFVATVACPDREIERFSRIGRFLELIVFTGASYLTSLPYVNVLQGSEFNKFNIQLSMTLLNMYAILITNKKLFRWFEQGVVRCVTSERAEEEPDLSYGYVSRVRFDIKLAHYLQDRQSDLQARLYQNRHEQLKLSRISQPQGISDLAVPLVLSSDDPQAELQKYSVRLTRTQEWISIPVSLLALGVVSISGYLYYTLKDETASAVKDDVILAMAALFFSELVLDYTVSGVAIPMVEFWNLVRQSCWPEPSSAERQKGALLGFLSGAFLGAVVYNLKWPGLVVGVPGAFAGHWIGFTGDAVRLTVPPAWRTMSGAALYLPMLVTAGLAWTSSIVSRAALIDACVHYGVNPDLVRYVLDALCTKGTMMFNGPPFWVVLSAMVATILSRYFGFLAKPDEQELAEELDVLSTSAMTDLSKLVWLGQQNKLDEKSGALLLTASQSGRLSEKSQEMIQPFLDAHARLTEVLYGDGRVANGDSERGRRRAYSYDDRDSFTSVRGDVSLGECGGVQTGQNWARHQNGILRPNGQSHQPEGGGGRVDLERK